MVVPVLILLVFLVFAYLMYSQKVSTLLALLGMAIVIALIGGIPLNGKTGLLQGVIETGSTGLASAIMALIFGAWLGEVMNETGITQSIIKRAAELGGDRPMVLAFALSAAVVLLFTTLTGLGAVIMVGTIVLPILTAVGVRPLSAGAIYLFARAAGQVMNLSLWSLYINLTKLSVDQIRSFALIVTAVTCVAVAVLIVLDLRKPRAAWSMPASVISEQPVRHVPIIALLTPIVPFLLVMGLKWPIIAALLAGSVFGVLTTSWQKSLNTLTKAAQQAVKSVTPALLLMVAIGIVLKSVQHPAVAKQIGGVISKVIPTSPISYFLFFALLAPLALYRGPLNVYGLGSGIIGILMGAKVIPAGAIAAAFLAANQLQLAGDPTNTHNVWTSDFMGLEVNEITKKLLAYLWIVDAICVAIAAYLYF